MAEPGPSSRLCALALRTKRTRWGFTHHSGGGPVACVLQWAVCVTENSQSTALYCVVLVSREVGGTGQEVAGWPHVSQSIVKAVGSQGQAVDLLGGPPRTGPVPRTVAFK